VTCAKPGHVEACMEPFRTCITSVKSRSIGIPSNAQPEESIGDSDHSHLGLIRGVRDPQNEKVRTNRSSLEKWLVSPVVWAENED